MYCDQAQDAGGRHDLFSRYAKIRANSTVKELNIAIINEKGGPLSRETGLTTGLWLYL